MGMLTACGGHDLPSGRVWESEHFRYHTRGDDPAPCPAIAARLDRNFEVLRAQLDFRWDAGWKVDYYKFRDEQDLQGNATCPDGFNCAWGQHVESKLLFDEHELVHAYLTDTAVPPLMFVEGLAQAVACRTERTSFPRVSLDELLVWRPDGRAFRGPGHYYDTAAGFVGHLWKKYGAQRFMRLYRALPRNAGHAVISQTFVDVLGVTVDEAWAEAFAVVDPQGGCIPLWACAQETLPIDGSATEWAATCTADDDPRAFLLPDDASLRVAYRGRIARPGACAPGRAPLLFDGSAGTSLTFTELAAGRYYLYKDGAVAGQIALSMLGSPLSGPSCAALTPLTLGADLHAPLSIALPESALPVAVRLQTEGQREVPLVFDLRDNRSVHLAVEASLCRGCGDDPGACVPVGDLPGTAIGTGMATLEGDQVLRVQSAEPSPDGFVTVTIDLR
jgi:hypothetical protein